MLLTPLTYSTVAQKRHPYRLADDSDGSVTQGNEVRADIAFDTEPRLNGAQTNHNSIK